MVALDTRAPVLVDDGFHSVADPQFTVRNRAAMEPKSAFALRIPDFEFASCAVQAARIPT